MSLQDILNYYSTFKTSVHIPFSAYIWTELIDFVSFVLFPASFQGLNLFIMLKRIFEILSNFLSSLFGKRKNIPDPKPVVNYDKPTGLVEDSSDIPQDTIVSTVKIIPINPIDTTTSTDASDSTNGSTDIINNSESGNSGSDSTPTVDSSNASVVSIPEPSHQARYLWCLDNGHGKLQPGKRSPLFEDGVTRFFEYEFNRDIVERIKNSLDDIGVQYFDVVPDYLEVGSFLAERVERANKEVSALPKIYVSIHSNAGQAASGQWVPEDVSGIETWYANGSVKGKKIATKFQQQLIAHTGWKNRNIKSTKQSPLYVLLKTIMPAILTENGFFNNKKEAAELMNPTVRQKIADAHVAAIWDIEKEGL